MVDFLTITHIFIDSLKNHKDFQGKHMGFGRGMVQIDLP
jgi:hypothetical protein